MTGYLSRAADAARRNLRHLVSAFRVARSGRAKPIGPTRSDYSNRMIQREVACSEIAKARRQKRKAPFREAYSLTNDLLRMELGRG